MNYVVEFYEGDDDDIASFESNAPFPDLVVDDRLVLSTEQTAGREHWKVRDRTVLFTPLTCKVIYGVRQVRPIKRGDRKAAAGD